MTVSEIPPSKRLLVFAAVVLAALLTGFGLLADEVVEGDTVTFDTAVTMLFRQNGDINQPWGPLWLAEAVRDITALGSVSLLTIMVVLVGTHLLIIGRRRTATFIVFATVAGSVISSVLKRLFDRPRPDVEAATHIFTASFPSGHSMLSAVVYLTIAFVLAEAVTNPRLQWFYVIAGLLLTLAVGISRIYLGVHYPTDVLAGWSLGASWALLCWGVATVLNLRRKGRTDDV